MMTGWFLLTLIFCLQGHCSALLERSETNHTWNDTTPVLLNEKQSVSILHPANSNVTPPRDSLIAVLPDSSPSFSKPMNKNTTSTLKHPVPVQSTPTSTIAVESEPVATIPGVSSSHIVRTENITHTPTSTKPESVSPAAIKYISASTQKAIEQANVHIQTEEMISRKFGTHHNASRTTFSTVTQTHSTSHEKPNDAIGTSTKAGTTPVETTDNATEWETSTPDLMDNTEESQTTEVVESTDSDEWTTEHYSESLPTEAIKTDTNLYITTTEFTAEIQTGSSAIAEASIPNGVFTHFNHPTQQSPSPLARLVLKLSKPGVFGKGKSVFEDDVGMETTSCPPGDVGLACRRAEARRGADECSGGKCEVCRSCDAMAARDWPHCCRENFHCCSELALACQQCNEPTLQSFCTKHFKRCF